MGNYNHNEAVKSINERDRRREEYENLKIRQSRTIARSTLPKFKCHKNVHAAKISNIYIVHQQNGDDPAYRHLVLEIEMPQNPSINPNIMQELKKEYICVPKEYLERNNPKAGGYYVLYEDGYESYSPAKQFEDGYTMIK